MMVLIEFCIFCVFISVGLGVIIGSVSYLFKDTNESK